MGEIIILHPTAPAPARRKRLRLSKTMRADAAFRAILADILGEADARAAVLRHGVSVEGLHGLRVALRRLEVMLDAFGTAFGLDWFAELRARIKAISARLSPARDLDVFLGEKLPRAAGDDRNFAQLRAAAQKARGEAWLAVKACIASEDFQQLLDDLSMLAQSRLPLDTRRIGPVARKVLGRAAKRVKKRGKAARKGAEADLHRLRIGLKKLRYLSLVFAPLHEPAHTRPWLKALKGLQDKLGALNDSAHVRTIVATLRREAGAELGPGAKTITRRHDRSRARIAKKALERYADLRRLKPFWD